MEDVEEMPEEVYRWMLAGMPGWEQEMEMTPDARLEMRLMDEGMEPEGETHD